MRNSVKKVSILGCGWLGLPLAGHLLSQHIAVSGSYRSHDTKLELLRWGIKPFEIDVNQPDKIKTQFFHCNVLVIALPPTKAGKEHYPNNIHKILLKATAAGVKSVYFTSSTSVYAASENPISESNAVFSNEPNAKLLLETEGYVRDLFPKNHCITRLGGLIGPGRFPGRFLAGREQVAGADCPVNFLSLEDGARLIGELICNEFLGHTFNLVAPEHPTKNEYYNYACALSGEKAPSFDESLRLSEYKLVKGDYLEQITRLEYLTDNWKLYLHSLRNNSTAITI